MLTGYRREHHLKAQTSQKVTDKFAKRRQNRTTLSDQNRDGFSEYKNFERELITGCCRQIYSWTYYIISKWKWKSGNLGYKPGVSFTNWEFRLQNRTFIYKVGVLGYKGDSRLAIYLLFTVFYKLDMIKVKYFMFIIKNWLTKMKRVIYWVLRNERGFAYERKKFKEIRSLYLHAS